MLGWLLSAALLAGVPTGQITAKTPQLEVGLTSDAAWTISTLSYGGTPLILPRGGQGALLSAGGKWYGGGSSKTPTETVQSFTATVDGKEVPLTPPQTLSGDTVAVSKQSVILTVRHQADTTFHGERIVQRHRFEATEQTELTGFYAFAYSFAPTFRQWLAAPLKGEVLKGELKADNGIKPNCPVRWMAQYDPAAGKGVVLYYVQPVEAPGAFNGFWDTDTYSKALAQPVKGAVAKDTKLDLTLVMQFFTAPAAQWQEQAAKVVKQLEGDFPQTVTEGPPQPRLYADGVPEHGLMTLQAGRYTVPFSADQAWTIYRIDYDGKTVAHERGYYGTVLIPKGSNFIGTGHTEGGREIVNSVRLTVDGRERPVEVGATVAGKTLTLTKRSTIWKLDCLAEVTLNEQGLYERTRLTALQPGDLQLIYYFMHCFVPTTKTWMAELPDGALVQGTVTDDGNFEISKDTRWVSQYDPQARQGLLCYTPRVISGPGSASKIWDLARYHKYYLQACGERSLAAGETLDYSVAVQVVPDETPDFAAARAAVAKLKLQYPPVP